MLATISLRSAIRDLIKSGVLEANTDSGKQAIARIHRQFFLQSGPAREKTKQKRQVSAIQRQKKSTKDQNRKLEENEAVKRPRPVALLRSCSVTHLWVRISKACSDWWVSSSRAFPTWWVRSSNICSAWFVRGSKASLIKSEIGQRPGHTQTKVLPFPSSRGESRE